MPKIYKILEMLQQHQHVVKCFCFFIITKNTVHYSFVVLAVTHFFKCHVYTIMDLISLYICT